MPDSAAAAPSANGSSVTITQSDWKAELIRPGAAWFTSLDKVAGICLILLVLCLGGLGYIAVGVLPNERRLLSESYEKIDQRHAADMTAVEKRHQEDVTRMFDKMEQSILRFESIAKSNKELVDSLLNRLLDGAVKK